MKKFLFAIVAMLLSAHVYAQPTSLWVTESNDSLQNYHIIKDWSGGTAIGVCTKRNGPLALAKVPFTATYPVAEPLLVLDPTIMNIYDMCIVDDEIFFCGNYLDSNSGDIIGFIGHANATSFNSADYVVFSSTSFVGYIVAYENPGGTGYKIVAVGRKPLETESFVGDQYIIEIDHDGTAFQPTATPPNSAKYAYPLSRQNIPEYMTVTDSYVAITGTRYDTPNLYFVIRCDKSSPVTTAQMYWFSDPAYMDKMPAPEITQLNKDTVALAYPTATNTSNAIAVHTLDLNTMADVYAQSFPVDIKSPTPHMVYFDITRKLVLFIDENIYPSISSAHSSFVYIDPYANTIPYITTFAFQSNNTINNRCRSIAKLGTRHFMGYYDKGWYSQEHSTLPTNCLDRTDINIYKYSMLTGVLGTIVTNNLTYTSPGFYSTDFITIDKVCTHP